MLSKRENSLDIASSSSTSSPIAYRRTSIPSIIPVSVTTVLGSSVPLPAHRAPLPPLTPLHAYNNPPDNHMSSSSSTSANSQRKHALSDPVKDADLAAETARALLGRHIISRPQDEGSDLAVQSARKRSTPGIGNSVRSLPYPQPRSSQQRRPSNTPAVLSSRRPSLPNTQYIHSTPQFYPDSSSPSLPPNTAPILESPSHASSSYISNEDLYSGLSTFTFGAARPQLTPSSTDSTDMVSPLTRIPGSYSADCTPRASIASSAGSTRRVRASKVTDPEEGDDECDEDEDDAARGKTRSKMRAIDDGTRRPSLPTNAFPPALSTEVPPPVPPTSHHAFQGHTELSPGASSGPESGLEDSEVDDGEQAEFDTDVEYDLQRTHGSGLDPPVSDTASQHTFGVGGYEPYNSSHSGDDYSIREEDEDDNVSMSPVTFSREHEPSPDDVNLLDDTDTPLPPALPPPVVNRRGSLPWDIPGTSTSRNRDSPLTSSASRDREDSAVTVTARRASRSVDDDLNGGALDSTVQSTSHPETRADFRSIEAAHSSIHVDQVSQEQADISITEAEDGYGGFDLEYILGREGRKSWSSGRPSYVEPRGGVVSDDPSTLQAEWDAGWRNGRRTSIASSFSDDPFNRHIKQWDGSYAPRQEEWSFKKESMDGRGPHRLSVSSSAPLPDTKTHGSTMQPGAQELWRHRYIGRFKVDRVRMQSDQPTKAPQQRLNVRHIPDPYSKGNTKGGPGSVIHKHSRAVAFSIFRNHGLFNKHSKSQARAPMNTSASILLATKKVQEQYTSTRTTSKLNSHGLLEDPPRNADGVTVFSQSGTVAPSARSRPSTAGRSDEPGVDRHVVQGDASSTSTGATEEQRQRSTSPPPPVPPKATTHRVDLSVSTVASMSSLRPSEDTRTTTDTSITDRSSTVFTLTNTSRAFSEAMEVEDDEHSPPRTSHAEAFATVDSSYLEHVRGRSEPRHVEESPSHGLLNVVRRKLLGQGGAKAQAAGPRESHFSPPWMTMAPRAKQEERERVIQNLNESFKDVGLLPTVRPNKNVTTKQKRHKQSVTGSIFEKVPPDSLYMLLPLWPGETDLASRELREDRQNYIVRLEERQFLLVYYIEFSRTDKKGESGKKRTRGTETRMSSHSSSSNADRLIALPSFRVCAKLVSYSDLRETGVRVPAYGLSISGSMTEAVQYLPPPSIRELNLDEVVIATCNSRAAGMEFLPDGLKKLGLCMPSEAPAPPISDKDEVPEEVMNLTPIGRAAVEMAWLGCMAVTSFGTL